MKVEAAPRPEYYEYRTGFGLSAQECNQYGAEGWRLVTVDSGVSYWERLGKL